MHQRFNYALCVFILLGSFHTHSQVNRIAGTDGVLPFDSNWKFFKADVSNGEANDLIDTSWRTVDLPHDWSIEDLTHQAADSSVGPFSKASVGGSSTAFTVGGTGWYRNSFSLDKNAQGRLVGIYFDGVYMNSEVWINGHLLGVHAYGYTPFHYDLTPWLNYGTQKNVIAVRVRNEGRNSRWYTGSGIYRHVWLTLTDQLHVNPYTVSVTTPRVSASEATVSVSGDVENGSAIQGDVLLRIRIVDEKKREVQLTSTPLSVKRNTTKGFNQILTLHAPLLWAPSHPSLYELKMELWRNNKKINETSVSFGIRSLSFSASQGLLLNGEKILLKGACLHHDNGILGARAIDRAEERKVELMKANGFNAIRCSHNPPSTAFLNACDRLGVLVIDEAFDMWEHPKNTDDYHLYFNEQSKSDLISMVERDRNHPAVIVWSVGNEIYERADASGLRITKQLVEEVHRLDPTRPVTAALCEFWEQPSKPWTDNYNAFALLDVGGYNYMWRNYERDHDVHPDRMIIGTESFANEAYETWQQVEKHSYVLGDFVWTGMDYLGEAGIGHPEPDTSSVYFGLMPWPWFNGFCGDLDLIGNKKVQSYYRDVVWRKRSIVMAVHRPMNGVKEWTSKWGWPDEHLNWTWPGQESKMLDVNVYTLHKTVRLSLNGKVIATKTRTDSTLKVSFEVPYEAGRLVAAALRADHVVDSVVLTTTGRVSSIGMTADRTTIKANKNDLAYVTVSLVDEHQQVVFHQDQEITFQVEGAGTLVAAGNAHPYEPQSFQQLSCKTYQGKCLVIVRPSGDRGLITLRASADHSPATSFTITCK